MSTTTQPNFKVVGARPVRHDGVEKVTGSAQYGADIYLPGMLHGKILRSPHAHARIVSIDTSAAETHPDVRAVATWRDLPPAPPIARTVLPNQTPLDNVFAKDRALYKGHPVAAVAATSLHAAQEALALIRVVYEPLPAVTTIEEALKPDAPVLHPHWQPLPSIAALPEKNNIAAHQRHVIGDVTAGFAKADVVIEREFRTKSVHQGYIEPHASTARWDRPLPNSPLPLGEDVPILSGQVRDSGRLTVWTCSQGHFGIQEQLAKLLALPVSQVRIIPTEIGGGFGGKLQPYLEPVAAALAKKSDRPVKMVMDRAEELEATGPAPATHVKVKLGATKDGRLVAGKAQIFLEAGAFPGAPMAAALAAVFSAYAIENTELDVYDVVTNKPKSAAYRAPTTPCMAFAVEGTMSELAETLGMDPIDLRIMNAARPGQRRADGLMNGAIGAMEVMQAVKSHPHYTAPLGGEGNKGKAASFGRGIAIGFCRNNVGTGAAVANVLADGTVGLVTGAIDIGGTRTAVSQMLAEALGITVDRINPSIGDTDSIGYTTNTAGSSVIFKLGHAVNDAANDIKRQLRERAAKVWGVPLDAVEYSDGGLRHKSDGELKLSFKQIAAMLNETGGPVVGRGNLAATGSTGSYSANIVDVQVDPETGKVRILRYTALQDVGRAIHPSYVEGQIQGGTAQGIGWALNEEYFMSADGKMLNTSLLDYRMPTAFDVPMIEAVMIEVPNPNHPFGAKGVGEANISPPIAALADAIYHATGVRHRSLPMNPGRIVNSELNSRIPVR
ncbi:MAG: xanthine dehydrogenase family protein molybdopterin-binding subunit [SAR202 cluster bacterium]|nr:xanthine dehydrogenase family protein molybdopterin-binding subunit [SAR202 cluster bacterium]